MIARAAMSVPRVACMVWLIVARRTVQGAYKGELFVSPCIAGLRK